MSEIKKMSYEKLQSYTEEFITMSLELLMSYGSLPTRLETERVTSEVIKFIAKYREETAPPIPKKENGMSYEEYYQKFAKPYHDKYGVYKFDENGQRIKGLVKKTAEQALKDHYENK